MIGTTGVFAKRIINEVRTLIFVTRKKYILLAGGGKGKYKTERISKDSSRFLKLGIQQKKKRKKNKERSKMNLLSRKSCAAHSRTSVC